MESPVRVISVFIYYRVAERDRAEAEPLVRSMQARLACRTGIAGRLLKKRGEPGLWLEVYEAVPQPEEFERQLARLEDEFDIAMFMDGPRHREVFETDPGPVPSC